MIQQIEPTDIHTGELTAPYGRGVNFEIAIDDTDDAGNLQALSNRLKAHGIELLLEPTEFWRQTGETKTGSLELRVLDPDGYYLRFSSEI